MCWWIDMNIISVGVLKEQSSSEDYSPQRALIEQTGCDYPSHGRDVEEHNSSYQRLSEQDDKTLLVEHTDMAYYHDGLTNQSIDSYNFCERTIEQARDDYNSHEGPQGQAIETYRSRERLIEQTSDDIYDKDKDSQTSTVESGYESQSKDHQSTMAPIAPSPQPRTRTKESVESVQGSGIVKFIANEYESQHCDVTVSDALEP